MKAFVSLLIVAFVVLCGLLVLQAVLSDSACQAGRCILLQQSEGGVSKTPSIGDDSAGQQPVLEPSDVLTYRATGGPRQSLILGAQDPNREDPTVGFRFQLQLDCRGAAINRVTFSNGGGKGFDNRDHKNPKPLVLLRSVDSLVRSLANGPFVLVEQKQQLDLGRLSWKSLGVENGADGSQTARFETVIQTADGVPIVKLIKSYTVRPASYLMDCSVSIENFGAIDQKVRFNIFGPAGIERESFRGDIRAAVAAFRDPQGAVSSERITFRKFEQKQKYDEVEFTGGDRFLWVAVVNKYFAAILVPLPETGDEQCRWIGNRTACYYNPDGRKASGDENIAIRLETLAAKLAPNQQPGSKKTYNFQLYIGPKDKELFDKNELYHRLGFVQTIYFPSCCCPASIIRPLSFGILALMKWMYGFIGNYGVVIIILVFLFRLLTHPITKKSQVSMSRMSKLTPQIEQIKKKYANNKEEMKKQMMQLYQQQGITPIMGMLPMLVQMPVWIALWSAVNASIELRGAPFLPVWITDLSAPDALFHFPAVYLPLLGKFDSFNLLPILMGVAFYLQQKLMPSQQTTSTNPELAQQQKIMMMMIPVLFPLMLYKAPSGVNLYIMASTFAGLIEQYVIRKHIREKEQAEAERQVPATSKTGGKIKKKKPKPFFRKF